MPIDQAEAIVLRSYPVGDQDKIVTLFCREKGLVRGVAKGARKFGNRFGSSLEPLTHIRAFYYEKERRELVTVSQCDILQSFFEAQRDFPTSCTLAYFAELVEEFFPSRATEDVVFRLLLSTLRAIQAGGDLSLLSRYFEAWFLKAGGLLPDLRSCKRCRKSHAAGGWLSPKMDGVYCPDCAPLKKEPVPPAIVRFLEWAQKSPPPEKPDPLFSPAELEAIGRTFQALIVYHLEREPKSLHLLPR
jgi:DNA repair protein RecO (recombination protein O)